MIINDIYTVSNKFELMPEKEVVKLLTSYNLPLYLDYINFVNKLGIGIYCNFVRILSIEQIVQKEVDFQRYWEKNFRWSLEGIDVSEKLVLSSPIIADTTEGDQIVFCPHSKSKFVVLPRGDSRSYWIPENLHKIDYWISIVGVERKGSEFKYFQSWRDRRNRKVSSDLSIGDVSNFKNEIQHQHKFTVGGEVEEITDSGHELVLFIPDIGGYIDLWLEEGEASTTIYYDKDYEHLVNRLQSIIENWV